MPRGSGPVPDARPFVGRVREMDAVAAHVAAAARGEGRVVLVTGEPGIGKTRLVEEAVAGVAKGRVVWGRCYDTEGTPAYWPWIQAIGRYASAAPAARLKRELGPDVAEIGRLVPQVLGGRSRAVAPPQMEEPRLPLFEAVVGFLRRAAVTPLVIVLDDVHWADSETLMLLHFVARELTDSRLLVLATLREAEGRQTAAVRRVLGDLVRVCPRVALRGLSGEEIAAFVQVVGGTVASPELTAVLQHATDGNPFFVSEVVHLLRDQGRLDGKAPPAFRMPDGVLDVIRSRLAPLPEPTRQVLSVGALIGRSFDVALLARAIGWDIPAVLDAVAPARVLGLVEETANARGLRFAHALVRDTLTHDQPAATRATTHRRIAEAMETQYGPTLDPYLGELAHHWFEAALLGGGEKAIDYAMRAGELAVARSGFDEAAGHLERALQAARSIGMNDERLLGLLLRFGEVQRLAGDDEGARATLLEAAQVAKSLGLPRQRAVAALQCAGTRAETGQVDVAVMTLLEDALRELPDDSRVLRASLLSLLARALYFTPEVERREEMTREALTLVREPGTHPAALAGALTSRHFVLWGPGRVEERVALATEAIEVGTAVAQWEVVCDAFAWLLVDLFELGDIDGVRRELGRYERVAEGCAVVRGRWHITAVRAALALLEGRLADAEALAAHATTLRRASPLNSTEPFYLVQMFLIREEQGRLAEIEPMLSMGTRPQTLPIWRTAEAMVHVACGRPDAARGIVADLAARGFADLPRDGMWVAAICRLAELCVQLDLRAEAALLLPLLAPHVQYWVVMGLAVACQGSVARYVGLLASLVGRHDEAVARLEQAVNANRSQRAHVQQMHSLWDLARALDARGGPGDAADARARRDEARELAERLGLPLPATAPAPESAAPPPPPIVAPGQASLRREGDYWTVACGDEVTRVRHTKGVLYLAELLRHPGREFHALDLSGAEIAYAGDAGEVLDADARRAYKARVAELQEELAEAEAFNDVGRVERLRTEMDAIADELARGVGLGGRARRASSDAERARLNVTRAIRAVVRKVAGDCPVIGRHLESCVVTGVFCSYDPDPGFPVTWTV